MITWLIWTTWTLIFTVQKSLLNLITHSCAPTSFRRLRDYLIEEERLVLAMEVSTKCGIEPVGVWVAMGKQCLAVGDYEAAREKFQHCLRVPVDRNVASASKLLEHIVEFLENTAPPLCSQVRMSWKLTDQPIKAWWHTHVYQWSVLILLHGNGLSPVWCQAIGWTSEGLLSFIWKKTLTHDRSKIFIPTAQRSCWGVYWFHSVRLSVRPTSVPHPVSAL